MDQILRWLLRIMGEFACNESNQLLDINTRIFQPWTPVEGSGQSRMTAQFDITDRKRSRTRKPEKRSLSHGRSTDGSVWLWPCEEHFHGFPQEPRSIPAHSGIMGKTRSRKAVTTENCAFCCGVLGQYLRKVWAK